MGAQLTKDSEDSSNQISSSPNSVRDPFDLRKESEKKVVKGDDKSTTAAEDDDDDDFDPNNYDPKTVGPILPNGDINWECPCLGGAASGPCGTEFRQAFSCFHYSKEDPKGSDCFPQFREMHVCFSKYPQLYPSKDDDDDDEEENALNEQEDDEDQIKFDEEELKVINDQNDNGDTNKTNNKENKEASHKETEPSVPPTKDKNKKPTSSSPRTEKKESILTPPQPAIM